MAVGTTWTNPTSSPPDLITGQTFTQQAWEMVLSNLNFLGGSTGFNGTSGGAVPSGAILPFGASTTDPTGYLLCDGRAVSRTGINAALFTAIGTQYGIGNGSTTFNIPDFRSTVPMGIDNYGTGAGARGQTSLAFLANNVNLSGEDIHVLVLAELAAHNHSHNHPLTDPNHGHQFWVSTGVGGGQQAFSYGGASTATHEPVNFNGTSIDTNTTGISISADATSAGSSTAHNNRQLSTSVCYVIKL